ncbi:MAG TPA: hypothetical protein VJY42_04260 [Candidatus Methanomethylophilaceae archaeon]|nr:hypothetical protein [Candidatus Methanomethylophilaceae archaeon]
MNDLNLVIAIIILILIAIVLVVLRREFRFGSQLFRKLKWSGSMTSAGCYYYPDLDEVELAPEFGVKKQKMTVMDAASAKRRKNGGVFLVYYCQNHDDRKENLPGGVMISVEPITMELARKIMSIRWGKNTMGALNVFTYNKENAFDLAKGNKDLQPIFHNGNKYGFDHYHRYFKEGGEDSEKSPRVFFGDIIDSNE